MPRKLKLWPVNASVGAAPRSEAANPMGDLAAKETEPFTVIAWSTSPGGPPVSVGPSVRAHLPLRHADAQLLRRGQRRLREPQCSPAGLGAAASPPCQSTRMMAMPAPLCNAAMKLLNPVASGIACPGSTPDQTRIDLGSTLNQPRVDNPIMFGPRSTTMEETSAKFGL